MLPHPHTTRPSSVLPHLTTTHPSISLHASPTTVPNRLLSNKSCTLSRYRTTPRGPKVNRLLDTTCIQLPTPVLVHRNQLSFLLLSSRTTSCGCVLCCEGLDETTRPYVPRSDSENSRRCNVGAGLARRQTRPRGTIDATSRPFPRSPLLSIPPSALHSSTTQ